MAEFMTASFELSVLVKCSSVCMMFHALLTLRNICTRITIFTQSCVIVKPVYIVATVFLVFKHSYQGIHWSLSKYEFTTISLTAL